MKVSIRLTFGHADYCIAAMNDIKKIYSYSSSNAQAAGEIVLCPGLNVVLEQRSNFSLIATISSSTKYDIKLDVGGNYYPIINIINKITDQNVVILIEDYINMYLCTGYEIHCF